MTKVMTNLVPSGEVIIEDTADEIIGNTSILATR